MRLDPVADRGRWTQGSIGTTVQGRQIVRWDSRSRGATRHVTVVSGMHGNERITYPLAEAFLHTARPADMNVTIIPSLNPDGWAANTRRNARGVDLNRNFPWLWSSSKDSSGPGPGSELETQAAMNLLQTERPDLVIWIHQPLDYVAPVADCPIQYAELWANAAGIQVRPAVSHLGGGESWSARTAGLRSMLVEVTSWSTAQSLVDDHVRGFTALLPHVSVHRSK
ncbi:MAG: DUF2817 domain-containing protein [Ilumatobacter sp.]|uniref:DUF2817 domain-containing protein n=1 Tax=Ilumatobacter sp. TaxID=1967498 RepID=UPI002A2DD49C|nr:DUF2817 domain-containing protein [Ilumatobacter sp.]MDG2232867.1 DUF2817 domain-containing protein [Ilumatobacter sp.]